MIVLDNILEFLKVLMKVAPEMAPKVETAIDKWGRLHNIPTDKYIRAIRTNRFDDIDARIDAEVDALDIPEG